MRIQSIPLTLLADGRDELDEKVVVTLSRPTNAILGGFPSHTYTIQDDDPAPTVAFALDQQMVAESAGPVYLTVRLSGPSGLPVSVKYDWTRPGWRRRARTSCSPPGSCGSPPERRSSGSPSGS